MSRGLPRSIHDANFLPLWRKSRRFVAHGMRLTSARNGTAHFTGGHTAHNGNKCPECEKRLTLLWDLDLHDQLVPDYFKDGLAPANRFPFFICWTCMAASYNVLSDDRIKCFPFDDHTECLGEDETPFQDAPGELPRRPIHFERIPSIADALLSLEDTVGLDEVDRA